MMTRRFLCLSIALSLCGLVWANKVDELLESATGDRVTVTYEVSVKDGHVEVIFHGAKKTLGPTYGRKYSKPADVAVVFFDYIGSYEGGTQFKGYDIEAFSTPAGLTYESRRFGYYLVQQQPKLSFSLKDDKGALLSIPIYLAHYERKLHYKVFAYCGNLNIKIAPPVSQAPVAVAATTTQTTVLTIEEEEAPSLSETDEIALRRANHIMDMLSEQKKYPFDSYLMEEVQKLRGQRSEIKDDKIRGKIDEVLSLFEAQEQEMKAKHDLRVQEQLKAKQDSIRKEQEQAKLDAEAREKTQQKRSLWMIIGGALLAVLLFVGSQVMQTVRNHRTQRSMMQMQQNAVRQAEGAAKRKARAAINRKTNQAINSTKRKAQTAMQKSVDKVMKNKGNKKISI